MEYLVYTLKLKATKKVENNGKIKNEKVELPKSVLTCILHEKKYLSSHKWIPEAEYKKELDVLSKFEGKMNGVKRQVGKTETLMKFDVEFKDGEAIEKDEDMKKAEKEGKERKKKLSREEWIALTKDYLKKNNFKKPEAHTTHEKQEVGKFWAQTFDKYDIGVTLTEFIKSKGQKKVEEKKDELFE